MNYTNSYKQFAGHVFMVENPYKQIEKLEKEVREYFENNTYSTFGRLTLREIKRPYPGTDLRVLNPELVCAMPKVISGTIREPDTEWEANLTEIGVRYGIVLKLHPDVYGKKSLD